MCYIYFSAFNFIVISEIIGKQNQQCRGYWEISGAFAWIMLSFLLWVTCSFLLNLLFVENIHWKNYVDCLSGFRGKKSRYDVLYLICQRFYPLCLTFLLLPISHVYSSSVLWQHSFTFLAVWMWFKMVFFLFKFGVYLFI